MKSSSMKSTVRAIALAVVSLVLACAVVGLAKWEFEGIKEIKDVVGLVMTVMLLPVVVYFIASGNLTELGAFGFAAKFAKTAKEPVNPDMIAYDDTQIMGVRKLLTKPVDQSRPGVMTMTIGGKVPYTKDELMASLDRHSQLRNFKLVVFLDSNKRVRAYMEAWVLQELVDEHPDEFVQLINSGQIDRVQDLPGVAKTTISTNSTNIEALYMMQKQNLETLVAVDQQGFLLGVVERVQVLSSIMLSLAR